MVSLRRKSVWTEHKAGDRVYFYNTQTKQSVWEKPDQLKTPAEVSIEWMVLDRYI